MMSVFRKAYVYIRDCFAGILEENDEGYSFSYDLDYIKKENAVPVSLTLPVQNESFTSRTLFSFFDGLIPEGWLLNVVSRNWKISKNDRFAILLVACKDPIGNVSIKEKYV
ncbi:MAG: HipA N-terminal domain-containing protein [Bacilli bacterium]|jgi:serine/threonine-protein kinase HipA